MADELVHVERHYPQVEVPQWTVMPNHIHAIIGIVREESTDAPSSKIILGKVLGGLKRAVTMFARTKGLPFGWQRGYYDHIIRDGDDVDRIIDYIANNVARWQDDSLHK